MDIEKRVNNTQPGSVGDHAVIFDSFKVTDSHVKFKLYSWGRVYHLQLSKATFLKNIDKKSFVIFNQTDASHHDNVFTAIRDEVLDKKDSDTGIILHMSGKEKPVLKNQKVHGFADRQYTYKGNGRWHVHH